MAWDLLRPLAIVSTSALALLAVVRNKSQQARYYINLALYIGTLLTTSILALGISVFLACIGQRLNTNYIIARTFYRLCSPLTGLRIVVQGEEHLKGVAGPAVMVGNHQSFIDILYLGKIFPKRASIMAKKELSWTPFLGWWMTIAGTVWIDRKKNKDAIKAMGKAGEDMKSKGLKLWVFPEGTRSNVAKADLLPFKKGAFHLAVQSQTPIIPVVCEHYNHLFDGKTRLDSGSLIVRVLPPIPTTGLATEDIPELSERTRKVMLDALLEISASRTAAATSANGSSSSPSDETARLLADDARHSSEETAYGATETEGDEALTRKSSEAMAREEAGTKSGTEDEMEEDGHVLVKRPQP